MDQQPDPGRSRRAWRFALAVVITGGLAAIVLGHSDLGRILVSLKRVDPVLLMAALVPMGVVVGLRTARFAIALRLPWSIVLARITTLHGLIASFVPMRMGEAAFPLLLGRHRIADPWAGAGALLVLRALEALMCLAIGGFALSLVHFRDPGLEWLHEAGLLGGLAGLAGSACLPAAVRLTARAARALLPGRLAHWSERVLGSFAAIRLGGVFVRLWLLTAGIFACIIIMFHLSALAVGIAPSPAGTALATAAAMVAFALPVNGIAGVGPLETAWTVTLAAQGLPWEAALTAGILAHAVVLTAHGALAALLRVLPAAPPARLNA